MTLIFSRRTRRSLVLITSCAMGLVAAQQVFLPPVSVDPRDALSVERDAESLRLDGAERACYSRFFTSNCLRDVARSRRTMLSEIRHKEAALDAADRQQRAQDAERRMQEKLQAQADRQTQIDSQAIEESQRQKQTDLEAKQQEHATKSATPAGLTASAPSYASSTSKSNPAPLPNAGKVPKTEPGPSPEGRAANRAVFEKKQADAAKRMAERAQSAASAASGPISLPFPASIAEPAK